MIRMRMRRKGEQNLGPISLMLSVHTLFNKNKPNLSKRLAGSFAAESFSSRLVDCVVLFVRRWKWLQKSLAGRESLPIRRERKGTRSWFDTVLRATNKTLKAAPKLLLTRNRVAVWHSIQNSASPTGHLL